MVEEGLFERLSGRRRLRHAQRAGTAGRQIRHPHRPLSRRQRQLDGDLRGTGGHGGARRASGDRPDDREGAFRSGAADNLGRNVAAVETAVFSVGHIAGGDFGSPNIIPSRGRGSRHRALLQVCVRDPEQADTNCSHGPRYGTPSANYRDSPSPRPRESSACRPTRSRPWSSSRRTALPARQAEAIAPQMNAEANLRFDSARLMKAPLMGGVFPRVKPAPA